MCNLIILALCVYVNYVRACPATISAYNDWHAVATWQIAGMQPSGRVPVQTDDVLANSVHGQRQKLFLLFLSNLFYAYVAQVVIADGVSVRVDANVNVTSIHLSALSTLAISDNNIKLSARWILVGGSFYVGDETCVHTSNTIVELWGERPEVEGSNPPTPCGHKAICTIDGGVMHIHGNSPSHSWTRLAATAEVDSTEIILEDEVSWQIGDQIAIMTTDFPETEPHIHWHREKAGTWQSEERTIVNVLDNGARLVLDAPLQYMHWGATDDPVSEQAEVALLTRNVKIQGDENSAIDEYGATVMCLLGGKMYLEAAEWIRGGQKSVKGRYPIHHHLALNQPGQYVKMCSLHHTFNRCITIHASHDVLVENNVCFITIGHSIFVEDGGEFNNTFIRNLVAHPTPAENLLPKGLDARPSGFWITNAQNTFLNNVAIGGMHGYWFSLPNRPMGPSFTLLPWVEPKWHNVLRFEGNVAHSSTWGVMNDFYPLLDSNGEVSSVQRNSLYRAKAFDWTTHTYSTPYEWAEFKNNRFFKISIDGFWSFGYNQHFVGNLMSDVQVPYHIGSTQLVISSGVTVGASANVGNMRFHENDTRSRPFHDPSIHFTCVQFYDHNGPMIVANMTVIDLDHDEFRRAAAFTYNTYIGNTPGGIHTVYKTTLIRSRFVYLHSMGGAYSPGQLSMAVRDADGSGLGLTEPRHIVPYNPFLTIDGCEYIDGSNAYHCPVDHHAKLTVELEGMFEGSAARPFVQRVDPPWDPPGSDIFHEVAPKILDSNHEEPWEGASWGFYLYARARDVMNAFGVSHEHVGQGLYSYGFNNYYFPIPRASNHQSVVVVNETLDFQFTYATPKALAFAFAYTRAPNWLHVRIPYGIPAPGAKVEFRGNSVEQYAALEEVASVDALTGRTWFYDEQSGLLHIMAEQRDGGNDLYSQVLNGTLAVPEQGALLKATARDARYRVDWPCLNVDANDCCNDTTLHMVEDGVACGAALDKTCLKGFCGGAPQAPVYEKYPSPSKFVGFNAAGWRGGRSCLYYGEQFCRAQDFGDGNAKSTGAAVYEEEEPDPGPTAPPHTGQVHSIGAVGNTWEPADRNIVLGDAVSWSFGSSHNVAAVADTEAVAYDGVGFFSGYTGRALISPFIVAFYVAGDFPYVCEPHAPIGMRGLITVTYGSAPPPQEVVVTAYDRFHPAHIVIERGASVRFMLADGEGGNVNVVPVTPGTDTVLPEGEWAFSCAAATDDCLVQFDSIGFYPYASAANAFEWRGSVTVVERQLEPPVFTRSAPSGTGTGATTGAAAESTGAQVDCEEDGSCGSNFLDVGIVVAIGASIFVCLVILLALFCFFLRRRSTNRVQMGDLAMGSARRSRVSQRTSRSSNAATQLRKTGGSQRTSRYGGGGGGERRSAYGDLPDFHNLKYVELPPET